jgi:hypothetical protein
MRDEAAPQRFDVQLRRHLQVLASPQTSASACILRAHVSLSFLPHSLQRDPLPCFSRKVGEEGGCDRPQIKVCVRESFHFFSRDDPATQPVGIVLAHPIAVALHVLSVAMVDPGR